MGINFGKLTTSRANSAKALNNSAKIADVKTKSVANAASSLNQATVKSNQAKLFDSYNLFKDAPLELIDPTPKPPSPPILW